MTITPITTDKTATITLSSGNTWVLEQGVNLFPDASVDADAMYGNNVSQSFVQLYGNIVTEPDQIGNAVGFGAGLYLDGVSDANEIHVDKGASILAGGYGIGLNGSNNSVLNAGTIDSYAAYGVSAIGNENIIVNRGSIDGFSGAAAVSGTSNFITNYGTMNISSFESDFGGTISTIAITSTDGQTNTLTNHGTIDSTGVAIQGGDGIDVIRNTGTIEGDINLGAGDDLVLNAKGTIEGNVDLGAGDDQYLGGSGDFVNGVTGGAGNDTYTFLGHMTNVIEAADGGTSDRVQTDVNGSLAANVEDLALIGDNDTTGRGNVEANQILGNGGDNRLYGAGGADILQGGGGSDLLNGGSGSDTADYEDSDEAVVVNLGTNTATGGSADGDTFVSIENLNGSTFGDSLVGSNDSNTINGLVGDDTLNGGKGNDFLTGGDGKDVFVFAKGSNHDTIEDFHSHNIDATIADTINLHAFHAKIASFTALKALMTDHGTDVDITIGTDVLTVIGVHKADFDKTDFIL